MSASFPKSPELQAFESWARDKTWFKKTKAHFGRNGNDTAYTHWTVNDRFIAFLSGIDFANSDESGRGVSEYSVSDKPYAWFVSGPNASDTLDTQASVEAWIEMQCTEYGDDPDDYTVTEMFTAVKVASAEECAAIKAAAQDDDSLTIAYMVGRYDGRKGTVREVRDEYINAVKSALNANLPDEHKLIYGEVRAALESFANRGDGDE